MSLNITFIAFIIILLLCAYLGYSAGFAKGLSNLIALAVTAVVAILGMVFSTSYRDHNGTSMLLAGVFILVLAFVYGLVRIALKSLKLLSHLPVIKFLDSILGLAVGIVSGVLVIEVLIYLAHGNMLPYVSERVMADVLDSKILTIISLYNPLM